MLEAQGYIEEQDLKTIQLEKRIAELERLNSDLGTILEKGHQTWPHLYDRCINAEKRVAELESQLKLARKSP